MTTQSAQHVLSHSLRLKRTFDYSGSVVLLTVVVGGYPCIYKFLLMYRSSWGDRLIGYRDILPTYQQKKVYINWIYTLYSFSSWNMCTNCIFDILLKASFEARKKQRICKHIYLARLDNIVSTDSKLLRVQEKIFLPVARLWLCNYLLTENCFWSLFPVGQLSSSLLNGITKMAFYT